MCVKENNHGIGVAERVALPAEPRSGADAQWLPLLRRSSHWARLTASVRLHS
jgi:hypothetical protein